MVANKEEVGNACLERSLFRAHILREGWSNGRTNDSLSIGSLTDQYGTGVITATHREGPNLQGTNK